MGSNSPPYCPVYYAELKRLMHQESGHSVQKGYAGEFNGDGKGDLLVYNGNAIMLWLKRFPT
jgi:hypothetical protein